MMKTRQSFKKALALLLCIVMFATLLPTFAFAANLKTPEMKSAKAGANGIRVTWNAVSGAASYQVYRNINGGDWSKLAVTNETGYTDKTAKDGVKYYYTVRCRNSSGELVSGHESPGVSATWTSTVLDPPVMKTAKATSTGVKVSWVGNESATSYQVYRKTGSSGSWEKIGTTTDTSYTDKTAKVGKTYYYTVRCRNNSGNLCSGHESPGVSITYQSYATPAMKSAEAGANGIVVKWSEVSGAPAYMVYRNDGGGWSRLGTTTSTSYTDKTAAVNTTYYYTVRVCTSDGKSMLSSHESPGVSASFAGRAEVSSLSPRINGVLVEWNSVPGVSQYRVYRKSGSGDWTRLTSTNKTYYTDTTAVSGTTYKYTIRGLDGSNEFVGTWDSAGKTISFYAAPTLVKASDESNGIRVTWEAVEGISTYRVYRKIGSGGWVKQADASGTSYLDTSVASGVEATYTVRCVKNGSLVSWYDSTGVTAVSTNMSPTFHDHPLLTGAAGAKGGIKFTWQEVNGVSKYQVYRKDTTKTSWDKLALVTSKTDGEWMYLDTSVKEGGKYSYTVACSDGSKDTSEKNETGLSATYFLAPKMSSAKNVNTGVEITWKAVDGVGHYRVYRKTGSGSWSVLASSVSGTSYIDTSAKSTYTYKYAVSCVVNGAEMSAYDENGISSTFYTYPRLKSVSATNSGVSITWGSVDGISKYRIYRKTSTSDGYDYLTDVSGTSYTDTSVSSGKKYTYTVRCVVGSSWVSGFDRTGLSITYYSAPVLVSATAGSSGITIKWNAVTGADYYQLYWRTETSSWKKFGGTPSTSYTTYTDKKVDSGVKYYYTVRVCDKNGNLLSGHYSPGVSAVAK